MNNLKELQLELDIAEKNNFDKREIDHVKNLIKNEKSKIKSMERKGMTIKEILGWVIGITLMATYSYSVYPQGEENLPDETEPVQNQHIENKNESKLKKLNEKKSKKKCKSKKENKQKVKVESEVEIEYELLNEPERLLYAKVFFFAVWQRATIYG